jgi:hypothetical protein
MTRRPSVDERDPLPPRTWEPTSHEWARRQAKDALAQALRDIREARIEAEHTRRAAHLSTDRNQPEEKRDE